MESIINFGGYDFTVRKDKDNNVCLTDLWRAAGADEDKRPIDWSTQKVNIGFIKAVSVLLKRAPEALLKTTRGRNGATYANPLIALEYAQFVNQQLGVIVNQVFLERIEEEKNPELIEDRLIKTYKRKGKSDKWITERFMGVSARNEFTSSLKAHGVDHEGYRNVTNAIYNPLYGGTSNVVREKKGLAKNESIRDNLPTVELAAIRLAELLAIDNMERNNSRGNAQCEIAATKASKAVASALLQSRAK